MDFPKKFYSATKEYSTYERAVPSPYMRHSFELSRKPESAKILISGLGFYELYVNGKSVTKGELAPYISNPDHVIYFDEYELAKHLKRGKNAIAIQLGNGRLNNLNPVWNFDKLRGRSAPKVAFEFVCDELSFDASALVCHPSPLYFDGLHEGNHYDARLEIKGWADADFDDSSWTAAIPAETPDGEMRLCGAEPIGRFEEHKPISIKKGEASENKNVRADLYTNESLFEEPLQISGGYLYDFGLAMAGISRLKIKGEAGQKIRLQYHDKLTEDGRLNRASLSFYPDGFVQCDTFICSGGEDVFEQKFTYYGYRYCYVVGITEEQASEDLLTAIEIHSAIDKIGDFECSDPDANAIYKLCYRSDISNFHYFLTDCPQREKNGWTGDASMSAEHVILTYNANKSWQEWLKNVRVAQAEDGSLPGIAPTNDWGYAWGNGPAWDSALFNLPYFLYLYRKDTEVIRENAHAMLRYLEYISNKRSNDGTFAVGLDDWAPIGGRSWAQKNYNLAPLAVTDTLMVMDICHKAEIMFRAVGRELNADFAKALFESTRRALRENLIDFRTMTVKGECQTSQAMAIFYGAFAPCEIEKAYEVLKDIIAKQGYSMYGGFLGIRVLFHVLAEHGNADLAYKMICKREFPSYGYLLDLGMTTLPEDFTPKCSINSMNHHFYGDVSHFFMRHIAGINIELGKIVIKPNFIKKLDYARASYTLASGDVLSVDWRREADTVTLTVKGAEHEFIAPLGYKTVQVKSGVYTLKPQVSSTPSQYRMAF